MTNFARIIDNVAIDVSSDPDNHFHPLIASQFAEVPDDVGAGWIKTGSVWTAPEPRVDVAVTVLQKIEVIKFMLLFTIQELVIARTLRATDTTIDALWRILDDPRTNHVDVELTSIQSGIEYTLSQIKLNGLPDLDVALRKNQIITGEIPS